MSTNRRHRMAAEGWSVERTCLLPFHTITGATRQMLTYRMLVSDFLLAWIDPRIRMGGGR